MTTENITSGFRACGIYPLNAAQVPEEAYLPSSLYADGEVTTASTTDVNTGAQGAQEDSEQAGRNCTEQIVHLFIFQITLSRN